MTHDPTPPRWRVGQRKLRGEWTGMTTVKGYMGSVSFDGRNVTIKKTARGEITVPADKINAISFVPAGLGMKGIRFVVGGGSASRDTVRAGEGHAKVAQDPYAVTFYAWKAKQFRAFADEVRAAQAAG